MALLGDDVTPLPSRISQAPEAYSVLPAVALSTASKAFCEWVISAVNLIMTTVGLLLLCSCGNIIAACLILQDTLYLAEHCCWTSRLRNFVF